MKLHDYIKNQQNELHKLNKEGFNDSMMFLLSLVDGNTMSINCVYGDFDYSFKVQTTIYELEDHKYRLLNNLNCIAKLIKVGNTDINNKVFEVYDNLKKWDCIKIIEIE